MQWGGMADQFDNYEKQNGITLELLRFFKRINYPISFSTKATWFIYDKRYRDLIEGQDNWHIKFSIINLDAKVSAAIEKGVPSPQERLKAMKEWCTINPKGGATLRMRPFIIGMTDKDDQHFELIKRAQDAGASAVTTEFFCLVVLRLMVFRTVPSACMCIMLLLRLLMFILAAESRSS